MRGHVWEASGRVDDSTDDSTAAGWNPRAVAPAVANAVYHATGKRVRDLPITAEHLL